MGPSGQFWWNWGIQLAIAVGTIGAVLVALFGEWLRGLVPPKLVLKLEKPHGRKTPVGRGTPQETVGRWYHLRVVNERRWNPAQQVQVLLTNVEEQDAAREYTTTWIGEVPIRWRHQEFSPALRTIGPPPDCDLCRVIKDRGFALCPLFTPFDLNAERSGRCDMIVTLQARGVQADSDPVRVHLAWDGEWAEGTEEMARHMIVRVVPPE